MSGSTNGASQSQSSSSGDGVPFDDPRSLLRVYPFATYTPTARVAEHFSPHTTTYHNAPTPASLYPQYADQFRMFNNPSNPLDWATRQAGEQRLRAMFSQAQANGETYQTQPYPSPEETATMTPSSHSSSAKPLPYSFLPPLDGNAYRDPPTPVSLASPSSTVHASEFFENYVDGILNAPGLQATSPSRSHQPSFSSAPSTHTTPTIARTLASTSLAQDEIESPDPLAMSGPSPSKKVKLSQKPTSPIRTHSGLKIKLNLGKTSSSTSNGQTQGKASGSSQTMHRPIARRLTPEAVINVRRPPRSTSPINREIVMEEREGESSGDDLDWGDGGPVDQDGDYQMSDPAFASPSPTRRVEPHGSGRTGERDQRSHFQKLGSLLENIFEESDSFPAEITYEELRSSRYFSSISHDGSHPLLSSRAIGKTIDYMARLKGKRRADGPEWDLDAFTRLLRLLERSMREGDDITVFDEPKVEVKKVTKAAKGKKDTKSPEAPDVESPVKTESLTDEKSRKLEADLQRIAHGGTAAAGVLTLLNLEGLPKQMYSEDLLSLAVSLTKDQITKVVFPVVSCLGGEKSSSAFLNQIVAAEMATSKSSRASSTFSHHSLTQILRSILIALPRITSLISRSDMSFSDSLVIQAVYLSISPLFFSESNTASKKKGKDKSVGAGQIASLMKTLRMEAMGCLRATFARYEAQRQWIIEEILSAIVKVPDQHSPMMRFQLANGSSVHTMSALLLQLLQAAAYGAVAKVQKLRSSVLEAEIMGAEQDKVDLAQEEARVCSEAIDSSFSSAKMVATYLVQRSGTTKANKMAVDTDYKAVLETLIADLLTVLYRPEWPAASLFLNVISRLMMNAVEDPKSGPEHSSAKSIALDHLGDIAARIRYFKGQMPVQPIPTVDEIISNADTEGAKALLQAHKRVDINLLASADEDDMYSCARDMTCVVWAQELHLVMQKVTSVIEKLSVENDEDAVAEKEKLQMICQTFRTASRDIWQVSDRLFETKDPRQGEIALQASISLSRGRPLQSAFDPILRAVGASLDSPVVALRSKALRALGAIVTVDPDVLAMPFVKVALEDRLSDNSPAVRDIAVDLVGKYIVQKPSLATEYYRHIADRINDSGVGVRKRVIKLLTGIFSTVTDHVIQTDICCRFVDAMNDSDDAVKALASKSLAELLYPPSNTSVNTILITEIVSEYHGDQRSLESAMQKIVMEINNGPARYRATVEALVSQLIDATEQPEFDALGHVKAVYLLCASDPSLIDTGKASVLLSYLRTPVKNADDLATNDMLFKIFRRSIPAMPRVTSTFATDLVSKLAPMASKPSGGFAALRELISCLCVAVSHLTREYSPLTKMLRACDARLNNVRQQYADGTPPANSTSTALMLYITALIVEHVNLDQLAQDDDEVHREIRSITELQLHEYFFDVYLHFSQYQIYQSAPSVALGSLFQAYPTLIIREEAVKWMEQVFASPDVDAQARLFRVIHDFLESEAVKKASGKSDKEKTVLNGKSKDTSESGISTAVVQRNIGAILAGSKSAHPPLQDAALSVLEFTVRQGLYHPLECMPILISLETSESPLVADRALALHSYLHVKHASLVNIRYLDFARASYEYQRSMTSEVIGHRHGEALLHGWYDLISEKRAWRIDLLKSFTRAFDYDVSKRNTVDTGLILYLSDNLATFEYKLQDEPMSVVYWLGTVIASCIHLASMLESGTLAGEPTDLIAGKKLVIPNSEEVVFAESAIDASIVVCLALATKNHLLGMWGLYEDKCLKHTPGKKSAAGDKPAARKGMLGLDLSRIPLVRGVTTVQEFKNQAATFLQLLQEDGSLGEH